MNDRTHPRRKLALVKETIRALQPRTLGRDELAQVAGGGCLKPSMCCTTSANDSP
jgi:hypothetical protein